MKLLIQEAILVLVGSIVGVFLMDCLLGDFDYQDARLQATQTEAAEYTDFP